MFTTEDDYTRAIKGASIHAQEKANKKKTFISKVFSLTTLALLGYVGFNYYDGNELKFSKTLPALALNQPNIINATYTPIELPESVQMEENKEDDIDESLVVEEEQHKIVKDDYLIALDNMEVDVLEDNQVNENEIVSPINEKAVSLAQVNLSTQINDIVDEAIADNSTYTKELKKEISPKAQKNNTIKSRVVVVKKGDTLASLSKKFYGNPLQYKKIIASNSNLFQKSNIIYEGQKIKLPY